ncbi:MAG TPA: flagellar biosynthetic protein FliQ [Rhodospirillaceae bacterium]|nr:flagellar biosynthetic protein FliQ [Candidatus Neomarinimicrobiota bacterium]HCX13860.1 flagellar biosynthetic protein FliQ [Rhodospirillaceae bacterium]|tara:strand:- start:523 stop:789 length:267 start_codon:yes stop_codon:yes gene_type:complete
MNEMEVLDIARDGMSTMLLVVGPLLLVGLAVGLIISIFQTLTHIQEMTLTFIPKIVAVFGAMIIFMPFMVTELTEFMHRIMDKIVSLG